MMKRTTIMLALLLSIAQTGISQQQVEWIRSFGGDESGSCYTQCIAEAKDGGYFLGGYITSQEDRHTLIKVDAAGELVWFSEAENERPNATTSIISLSDTQVVASGYVVSGYGAWVTSYGENGQVLWTYFDVYRNDIVFGNLIKTADGEILAVNHRATAGWDSSFLNLRWISPEGECYRDRDYGFTASPARAFETDDGYEFILSTEPFPSIFRVSAEGDSLETVELEMTDNWPRRLVRLSNGNYLFPRAYAHTSMLTWFGNNGDSISSRFYDMDYRVWGVIPEPDESLTLFGSIYGDPFLMRTNSEGDSLWTSQFDTDTLMYGERDAIRLEVGGYLMSGSRWESSSTGLLKTSQDTSQSVFDPIDMPIRLLLHPSYPNPFNSSATITYDVAQPGFVRLGVYDMNGRLVGTVREGHAAAGRYREVWNGAGIPSGEYWLKLQQEEHSFSHRIILLK